MFVFYVHRELCFAKSVLWNLSQRPIISVCFADLVCASGFWVSAFSLSPHVLSKMNHGADMLSRNNVSSGEWMLHPLAVQRIWGVFGRARVDLFASEDNSHWPIFFTKSTDALTHKWPSLPLNAFPPIALLLQVLRQVKEQWHKLILIASLWRNQPWMSELFQLLEAAPWSIKRMVRYGIHGPSYGPCMCGRSTGDFRPPRACPKHNGRS